VSRRVQHPAESVSSADHHLDYLVLLLLRSDFVPVQQLRLHQHKAVQVLARNKVRQVSRSVRPNLDFRLHSHLEEHHHRLCRSHCLYHPHPPPHHHQQVQRPEHNQVSVSVDLGQPQQQPSHRRRRQQQHVHMDSSARRMNSDRWGNQWQHSRGQQRWNGKSALCDCNGRSG